MATKTQKQKHNNLVNLVLFRGYVFSVGFDCPNADNFSWRISR
jgi:hypothetical protein